ncbi:MAG: ATP-binding protein [Bryobacterales bacterium]|nr:ATP-binding protein [Bryobacterales bacterium]
MIHKFSVSNLRSIREKVVLDLRIPNTAPDLPRFRRSIANPKLRLPTVVVLMGANGSGKTALLDALVTAARVAGRTVPSEPDIAPIAMLTPFFSNACAGEPTEFCLEFEGNWLAPNKPPELFRYEVVVERKPWEHRSERFRSEALSYFPKGRPRRLFERSVPNGHIYSSGEFGVTSRDPRLKAVRSDASVIATLAQLNVPVAMRLANWLSALGALTNIMHYVDIRLPIRGVADLFQNVPKLSDWFSERIQCSDLGISGFDVIGSGDEKTLSFSHDGIDVPIILHFESSGTKRLVKILPLLYKGLAEGIPAVFDEIDGDLHVDIVIEILNWFSSRETNPQNSQLFVTSHNVGLLDELEKEELFIVEKSRDGATRLHGAQDVKGLRRDVRLYPKYRVGVLGGVPRVG